jgi:probable rRNA maturation factor
MGSEPLGPRVLVSVECEAGTPPDTVTVATEARAVLGALGVGPDSELSVLLVDAPRIHELNRQWRDRDRPTDVLSFPQLEPGEQPTGPLGDVVLNVDALPRQAAEHGLTADEELRFLLIHAALHLLGHDHHDEAQRTAMESEEQRIWRALGGRGTIR